MPQWQNASSPAGPSAAPPPYRPRTIASPPTFFTECHEPLDTSSFHPLMAAAYHNRTYSPLCSLPDAVLVRLMRLADDVTVEMLRRCSRVFLRLFPDACRSPADFGEEGPDYSPVPWPLSKRCLRFPPAKRELMLSLLARDQYCETCLLARQSPGWDARIESMMRTYLHCSECRKDHPACLFSAKQRQMPQSKRVCIGHEGFLRLCEHETVTWSQLRCKAAAIGDPPTWPKTTVVVECKRNKHRTVCGNSRTASLGIVFPRFNKPNTPFYTGHPSLRFIFSGLNDIVLSRAWTAHVPLDVKDDGGIEAEGFARALSQVRARRGPSDCPELTVGQVGGSSLFDPSRCSCLDYHGRDQVEWHTRPSKRAGDPCPSDPRKSLVLGKAQKGALRTKLEDRPYQCGVDILKKYSLRRTTQVWQVSASLCSTGTKCLWINQYFWLAIAENDQGNLGEMRAPWYHGLDPASYGLNKDTEGSEYPEKLVVYHAGTGRTTFLACLKVTTVFTLAFYGIVVTPSGISAGEAWWKVAGVALCGLIPFSFIAYATSPFVSFVHIHLPAYARYSKEILARFAKNPPASTPIEITTISAIGKPRVSSMVLSDLRPANERFGLVNYVRDTTAANARRRWYMYPAVGNLISSKRLGTLKNRKYGQMLPLLF